MYDYKVGDVITYMTWTGEHRTGAVTFKSDDIKNGRPGFDMRTASGETYWGYDDQIVAVRQAV